MSTAYPAVIATVPPPNTTAKFWHNNTGTEQLFTLTYPTGTIFDLDLDLVLFDDEVGNNTYTPITGVSGQMYYLALDGFATNVLQPVSLITTF
jgi:hypothetical protein